MPHGIACFAQLIAARDARRAEENARDQAKADEDPARSAWRDLANPPVRNLLFRNRAAENQKHVLACRLYRLRQAVEAFRPLLQQLVPERIEWLQPDFDTSKYVSRSTTARIAKRLGCWHIDRRGWFRQAWYDLTDELVDALIAAARKAHMPMPIQVLWPTYEPLHDPASWLRTR